MGSHRLLERNATWRAMGCIPVFVLCGCGAADVTEQSADPGEEGTVQSELSFDRCRPLTLANGSVSYSTSPIKVGTVATHSCLPGFTLSGNSTRTCRFTGWWSGTAPRCVASQQLVVTGGKITATEDLAVSGVMATVSDANPSDSAGSLSATIAWGDGSTSYGAVSGGSGSFAVSGSHTYASAGSVTVTITVSNVGTGASASASVAATVRPTPVLTEFSVGDAPRQIISNPSDGRLWFSQYNSIGRITTTGSYTGFSLPGSYPHPSGLATNSGGTQIWYANPALTGAAEIGYMDTFGNVVAEFTLPTPDAIPFGIVLGPDGAFWFAEQGAGKIGRITTAGALTEYAIPVAGAMPTGIAVGPDNNLWFGEMGGMGTGKIGRITTSGVITEWAVPSGASCDSITRGPDGNMWFTEGSGSRVGRITMAGVITEFATPSVNSGPSGIVTGPDGNLWFAEQSVEAANIVRITPTGAITEIPTPEGRQPLYVAAGPDGNIWFTEMFDDKVGRLTP